MSIRTEIIEALHNYSYRCVGKKDNIIIFAKPFAYSVIKAEIILSTKTLKLELSLIVKGNDDENLVWTSINNKLENIENNEEYYLNVVQIIMDFEASITKGYALKKNRNKRFDFIENMKCLNELNYE